MNKNTIFITAVLFLAFLLRAGTFFSPHDSWDQVYYTCVAMKLDTCGFAGYSLQHVGFQEKQNYVRVYVEPDDAKNFLSQRKELNAYNEPVFYAPPVLPFLLKVSHDVFAGGSDHMFINGRIWRADQKKGFSVFYAKEFYKTVIPLTFSLLTILIVMLFCLEQIGPLASFYAGLLLSVNPVDIMAANKIWTDDIFTFFFTAALLLLYYAHKNNCSVTVLFSGIMAGLAMLTRNFGIVLWPIALIHGLCSKERKMGKFILFLLITAAMSAPWFLLMIKTYGTPLHQPDLADIAKFFPFVIFVFNRPWYTYIVNIIVQNPIWILSIWAFVSSEIQYRLRSLLAAWVLVPLLVLICLRYFIRSVGIEDRYMLPAYPALAMAASLTLSVLMQKYKTIKPFMVLLIICSCLWSVYIAVTYTYKLHSDCIPLPL